MKIAIPTNDGTSISEHFGRSAGFLIFETENGKVSGQEIASNQHGHSHAHHHGAEGSSAEAQHHHEGILSALAGCKVVICAGIGQRAAQALKAGGINEIILAEPGSAVDAVSDFLAGKLISKAESFCRCKH